MWRALVSSSMGLALCLSLLTGCDEPTGTKPIAAKPAEPPKKTDKDKDKADAAKDKDKKDKADAEAQRPKLPDKFDFAKELTIAEREKKDNPPANTPNESGRPGSAPRVPAIDKLAVEVRDSLKVRNTLVVWVLDQTSGSQVRTDAASAAALFYRDAGKPIGDAPPNTLYTAVVAYADAPEFLTKEPLSKESDVRTTITGASEAPKGKANTFAAVKAAADEFLPFRDKLHCQMIVVLLSMKAGDDPGKDYANVDAAESLLKKQDVPVFALGASTPFSQAAAKGQPGVATESHDWERVEMDYPGTGSDADLNDTGFPPYAIGRLCFETGGQFFAQRPLVGALPRNFDPGYFRKYAPSYLPEEKFKAMVEASPAKKALLKAARDGGHVEVLNMRGSYNFFKTKSGAEADFNNAITTNQRESARIDGGIGRLLTMLQAGEADRKNVKEPRWQANFDLAIGRAYAAKARAEGLDTIMATMKGRAFTNPESNQWIITSTPTTPALSGIDKLVKNARMYLERVIQEHPGTPWAASAERELYSSVKEKKYHNMGWELKETAPGQ